MPKYVHGVGLIWTVGGGDRDILKGVVASAGSVGGEDEDDDDEGILKQSLRPKPIRRPVTLLLSSCL